METKLIGWHPYTAEEPTSICNLLNRGNIGTGRFIPITTTSFLLQGCTKNTEGAEERWACRIFEKDSDLLSFLNEVEVTERHLVTVMVKKQKTHTLFFYMG